MSTPTLPALWSIPYQRNPFFTGREEVLSQLHHALQMENVVALSQPQGITGLGGIGKTQTVLEYAYRYRNDYDAVLWVRADSTTALTASLVELAQVLKLPERDRQDQEVIIQAVLRWFRLHTNWLLIYDNIDNLFLAEPFLPKAGSGHLLFTTRSHMLGGLAQRLDIQKMEPEVGALLLLRRASILALPELLAAAHPQDQSIASAISQELDGLPLALDQAGAYIKEAPCPLPEYLIRYRARRSDLLHTRGTFDRDYPASVATTWSLSFEKLAQAAPEASELLNFCAFLAPDAIPEEILTVGAAHLGPILAPVATHPIQLDHLCREVLRFSLFQRGSDDRTLTVHRLVQAVLLDGMSAEVQCQWMERAVNAVEVTFPSAEFTTWPACERLLPHALSCAFWVKQASFVTTEAANLLNRAGRYLSDHAQYAQAEPLLEHSVAMRKQCLGAEHIETVHAFHDLAHLYREQGRHKQAEQLFQQTLRILEEALGVNHPSIIHSLHALAALSQRQGNYQQAEQLFRLALDISERRLEPEHPDIAHSLHGLAHVCEEQGKYEQAEQFYLRALCLRKDALGSEHYLVAQSMHGLASIYRRQRKYELAEQLFRQTIHIWEQGLGRSDHPDIARSLHGLAHIYEAQGKSEQAESHFLQTLAVCKHCLGDEHPEIATILRSLALFYQKQGRMTEAEQLCQQALLLFQQVYGQASFDVCRTLMVYAYVLIKRKKLLRATHAGIQALNILRTWEGARYILLYAKRAIWKK